MTDKRKDCSCPHHKLTKLMNLGENCLSSELLSCGGSPFTTCVSWSKTLFHFGYGNLPVASSYWKQTHSRLTGLFLTATPFQFKPDPQKKNVVSCSELAYQGDSKAPHIGTDIVTLSGSAGVYPFRLKRTGKKKKPQRSKVRLLISESVPSFSVVCLPPCRACSLHLWFWLWSPPADHWCQNHTAWCCPADPLECWKVLYLQRRKENLKKKKTKWISQTVKTAQCLMMI